MKTLFDDLKKFESGIYLETIKKNRDYFSIESKILKEKKLEWTERETMAKQTFRILLKEHGLL